ncbi:MAG: 30S ribosomal protein S20 [Chthoniobacteraceae bacterium]|nr:30S ribosomal protein S20 [Chthoniobacteraceae bacterium]
MANTKSAAKRAKQTVVRTEQNHAVLSAIKTHTKTFEAALKEGKKDEAKAAYKVLVSSLDKAAKEGRVHQNLADRRKSRLAKKAAALA